MLDDMPAVRLPRLLKKELDSGGAIKEAGRFSPSELSIELNLAPLSRATMTLPPDGLSVNIHDFVEIYNQNGSVGVFWVAGIGDTVRGQKQIRLNHALDVLSAAVVKTEEEISGPMAQVLSAVLDGQTQKFGGVNCWRLGDVEDETEYTLTGEYPNAMQCLTDIAKNRPGYSFSFDMSAFPWVLHFRRLRNDVLSEFRLRRNVEKCQIDLDDGDQCNRLYLSINHDGENDGYTGENPEIKIYNDAASQAIYGIIEKTDSIRTSETPDADAYAADFFARFAMPRLEITIDGQELYKLTGESIDEARLGAICRAALPEHERALFEERIASVKYPNALRTPARVTVSMANQQETAGGLLSQTAHSVKGLESDARKTHISLVVQDEHLTEIGAILHEAGIEIDTEDGVWLFAKEEGALGNKFGDVRVTTDGILARVENDENETASSLRILSDEIATKVSQTEFDTIEGTVTRHETAVQQATRSIALIATDKDLETAETRNQSLFQIQSDAISAEVTRAAGAEETLSSRIALNADSIAAAVGRIADAEGGIEAITGSALWETRDNITAAVGQMWVDNQGTVHIKDGSGLMIDEGQFSYGVYTNNNLTAGVIVDKINNGTVAISGAKVNLSASEEFTSEVTRSTEAEETLSARITETAASIVLEAARARTMEDSLSGRISLTSTSLSGAVGRINAIEEDISDIEGSALWATRDDITAAVGNMYVDANGKLHIRDGSGLLIDEGAASLGVYTDNSLTAGVIVDKINGGNVTIQANRINLNGYVTASELYSELAAFGFAEAGVLDVETVDTGYMNVGILVAADSTLTGNTSTENLDTTTLRVGGNGVSWQSKTVVTNIYATGRVTDNFATVNASGVVNGYVHGSFVTGVGSDTETIYYLGRA